MTTAMTDNGVVPALSMGVRLELARRNVNMTQPQLADELGISKRTVQDFEADVRPPKRGTMIAWAQVTGVSLAWLENGWALWDSNPQPAD